ncbi:PQQ-dependent sugar dehydrogenase [Rubrivirga sp. S365]|uniref:PQQ-dependent sugar dehydrogenase n=1 Tax=Rubrivirga litoralis TaxID=3075598 RepID=A0ABU3BR75_9BACT|nr:MULTISPECIES: PQQ-dependent sugar dehydrogenase [unclassified Rubrivirga]MDT0631686.1 PQQ-dependent sugar dehydrogenase [Rubrivirga sp. F394]MDT7855570.1 PQQ-dependent sugar dehydrogenase [Rubrivirga sp. S365]
MRPVLLAALLAACSSAPSAPAPPADDYAAADSTDLPQAVRTETLAPAPIRITVDELPEPFASESVRKGPDVVDVPDDAFLRVPAGFAVQVWADDLESPRWLALAPDGSVLLAASRENTILRLQDADGDGVAEDRETFATADANALDLPMGMAFADGAFFVGNTSEVRRYPYAPGAGRLEGEGTVIADLPGGGYNQHWTRNVVASPDGDSLYVTVGSESNVDPEELPRASVFRITPGGAGRETVSFGLRNPVGLDFHPATGVPYVTVNERDRLGDGLVPDYLTSIGAGADGEPRFYGWPYAYFTPDNLDPRRTDDGQSERPDLAAQTVAPDVLFESHSAALGLAFYPTGATTAGGAASFPARYQGGAFVAFRGSWNKSQGTGYKVVFVPFEDGRPTGTYEDFLTGFLIDPAGPTTWGRPVGVLVLPDGSLLVTEEANGRIYRVSYTG